jgi:hypothetical protein
MKHTILTNLILVSTFFLSSCNKDNKSAADDTGDLPKSAVPAELAGKYWHAGSFSMTQYSNYDGSYAGQAFEISTGYKFAADGTAEQYFYWTKTTTYCREQILGYRKGTVVFDSNNKTFKFYAASGNYRRYNNCGSSQSPDYGVKKQYGSEDLYPAYTAEHSNWSIVQENGKMIWRITYPDNTTLDYSRAEEPE